jgi:hypothetical protein
MPAGCYTIGSQKRLAPELVAPRAQLEEGQSVRAKKNSAGCFGRGKFFLLQSPLP